MFWNNIRDSQITQHLGDIDLRRSVPPEVSRFQGSGTVNRPQPRHLVYRNFWLRCRECGGQAAKVPVGTSPGHGFFLPRIDRRSLTAVRAGDPVSPGRGEDRDEKQGEFGGAFLEVVVNEPATVLAGCRPSRAVFQDSIEAEEEKHRRCLSESWLPGPRGEARGETGE